MTEFFAVPRILIGNRQLPPDATLMSAVEFSPQSAVSASIGQSTLASAGETDIAPVVPAIIAKATILEKRMVDFLVSIQNSPCQRRICAGVFSGQARPD